MHLVRYFHNNNITMHGFMNVVFIPYLPL